MVLFLTISLTVTRGVQRWGPERSSFIAASACGQSSENDGTRVCPYSERSVGIDIDVANSLEAVPNHGEGG